MKKEAITLNDYLDALDEFNQAKQNFDNAHPDYIDVALYQLRAAEEKLSAILREQKKGA